MTAQRISFPRHRMQSGQALVLTIAFSAVTAVMVFFLFSTAQLANQKTKLQNTADAAAFSSGVLQARDYNFSAYTNRAMVANHVAMAQFVGLDSWTEELQVEFKQDVCIPPIPFLPLTMKCSAATAAAFGTAMWNAPQSLALQAAKVTRQAFNAEKPIAKLLEPLIKVLVDAQKVYHAASLTEVTAGTAVNAVVKANDPNASISRSTFSTGITAKEIVDWPAFTKTLRTQPELRRFANVTVDSAAQDGFTKSRKKVRVYPAPWIPYSTVNPLVCPGAEITGLNMEMGHGGGTQMSQDMTRWFAIDSAGVAGAWFCIWVYGPVVVPFFEGITSLYMDVFSHGGSMAGASARYRLNGYSSPSNSYRAYGGVGGALAGFGTPAGLVRFVSGPGNNVASNYTGMRPYEDVAKYGTKPANQTDALNVAPTLTIEVEKKGADIRTAAQVLPGNNMLKLNDNLKGNVMRAVASSQAYFLRPARADHRLRLNASYQRTDNKTEYASLFNPYWQARLVATPRLEVELSTSTQ